MNRKKRKNFQNRGNLAVESPPVYEQRDIEESAARKWLLVVLFLGFVLRLAGITWGLPLFDPLDQFYHADEGKIINGAVGFPGHMMSNTYFAYPTFYHYMIGILSLPLRLFLGKEPELYYNYTYLLGRICSVLIGTAAIWATYVLGKKLYDRKRALLASVFVCFSLFHCQNSAFTTVDVLTSLWVVLFFLIAHKAILQTGTTRDYLLAGVVFGLSFGTKQTTAITAVAFLTLYIYSVIRYMPNGGREKYIWGKIFSLKLFLFGLVAIIAFFITTPSILMHFKDFMFWMRFIADANYQGYVPRTNPLVWIKVLKTILRSVGIPLGTLFLLGLVFPLKKRKVEEVALILLIMVYFIYFGNMIRERYVILVTPFMALLASHAIMVIHENKRKIVSVCAKTVMVGTILFSAVYCVSGVYVRLNDTRTLAAHYIQENIAPGTTVGIAVSSEKFSWQYHGWRYPKIDFTKYKDVYFYNEPNILVLSSYDFEPIEQALKSEKLRSGYVWDSYYNNEWYRESPPPPAFFKFYDDLLNNRKGYALLKSFKKNNFIPIELESPEIRIYKKI